MSDKQVHPEGSLIMRAGSLQRNAYIIERGRVEVSQLDENGIKKVLAVRGPKEIIGEMTLLEGGTRCASIIALEECELSVLTLDKFNSLPDSNPGVKAIRKIMNDRKNAENLPK
jgi:CRP/FNR family transcriptional regulator, cyclic AMP receptor protein